MVWKNIRTFAGVKKDMDLERCTLAVCEIAQRAGAYIREEREKFSLESVERKHAHDYVSYVDKGSERLIVSALRELLPEAGFIPEEGTTKADSTQGDSPSVLCGIHTEGTVRTVPLCWVVDPDPRPPQPPRRP